MAAEEPVLPAALPVVLVGGLHADARRAAVERLLHTVPGSIALHHDLATAAGGTVRRTVRDRTGLLAEGETPLVNDCACCALREDLVPELERLADSGLCRLAVVELWDSVEPKAMAEVVAAHCGDDARLTGVFTAVDPALTLPTLANGDDLVEAGLAAAPTDERTVGDTFARQLEYVSVLAVVEATAAPTPTAEDGQEAEAGQEADADADVGDYALLAQLTPAARQIPVDSAELAAAAVAGFDVQAAAARQHPACALLPQEADAHGVATLVWRGHRPFHPGRLYEALEDLTCAAARSRGRFWLADRPDTLLSWDAAGGALCVENAGPWLAALPDAAWEMVPAERRVAASLDWHPEHGDRGQCLTFTSPGLDGAGLRSLLGSCLLTDAEYAGGPDVWRGLSRAFDQLLDPVS
ncbi:GTP-binding protein [Streptomyces cinnamoneus]|uniref:Cobalamin biosynthesis protein CobW n=1 Tax=Streptomyces cinnamoneus TaxID=53446 RepID=A0A918WEH0_STRCJ|nr:GTP-binding protein [Streptomyces cinnamoneus]GHC35347.1 cobalamin biosynthesis protein CobW [Streptomyces cinnamoneus]